jgi:nitroreductase
MTDRKQLDHLAQVHPYGKMLAAAGAAIAVCGDATASPDYWIQDCSAATENILVAAAMLGLGTCWLGMHPRKERVDAVRAYFDIPAEFGILSLIAIGVPADPPPPRTQYDATRIHAGRW